MKLAYCDYERLVQREIVKVSARAGVKRAGGVLALAIAALVAPSDALFGQRGGGGSRDDARRYRGQREAMVELISVHGVTDSATIGSMLNVPRHEFVPQSERRRAYGDHPLRIGHGQTISQPYIVAYMTEILGPEPGMKVLEVGTGSGYQASVLAAIGVDVYTIEIFEILAATAREQLARLGYDKIRVRHGTGTSAGRTRRRSTQ